jgi:hypothetical protein
VFWVIRRKAKGKKSNTVKKKREEKKKKKRKGDNLQINVVVVVKYNNKLHYSIVDVVDLVADLSLLRSLINL